MSSNRSTSSSLLAFSNQINKFNKKLVIKKRNKIKLKIVPFQVTVGVERVQESRKSQWPIGRRAKSKRRTKQKSKTATSAFSLEKKINFKILTKIFNKPNTKNQ